MGKYRVYRHSTEEGKAARRKAGSYVQKLRQKAELTQAQLAKKLGYEWYTFVSQVETGLQAIPSEGMVAWAEALDVDPSEFAWTLLKHYDPNLYVLLREG